MKSYYIGSMYNFMSMIRKQTDDYIYLFNIDILSNDNIGKSFISSKFIQDGFSNSFRIDSRDCNNTMYLEGDTILEDFDICFIIENRANQIVLINSKLFDEKTFKKHNFNKMGILDTSSIAMPIYIKCIQKINDIYSYPFIRKYRKSENKNYELEYSNSIFLKKTYTDLSNIEKLELLEINNRNKTDSTNSISVVKNAYSIDKYNKSSSFEESNLRGTLVLNDKCESIICNNRLYKGINNIKSGGNSEVYSISTKSIDLNGYSYYDYLQYSQGVSFSRSTATPTYNNLDLMNELTKGFVNKVFVLANNRIHKFFGFIIKTDTNTNITDLSVNDRIYIKALKNTIKIYKNSDVILETSNADPMVQIEFYNKKGNLIDSFLIRNYDRTNSGNIGTNKEIKSNYNISICGIDINDSTERVMATLSYNEIVDVKIKNKTPSDYAITFSNSVNYKSNLITVFSIGDRLNQLDGYDSNVKINFDDKGRTLVESTETYYLPDLSYIEELKSLNSVNSLSYDRIYGNYESNTMIKITNDYPTVSGSSSTLKTMKDCFEYWGLSNGSFSRGMMSINDFIKFWVYDSNKNRVFNSYNELYSACKGYRKGSSSDISLFVDQGIRLRVYDSTYRHSDICFYSLTNNNQLLLCSYSAYVFFLDDPSLSFYVRNDTDIGNGVTDYSGNSQTIQSIIPSFEGITLQNLEFTKDINYKGRIYIIGIHTGFDFNGVYKNQMI